MKRLLSVALLLALGSSAFGQIEGNAPPGQVRGNNTAGARPGQWQTMTSMFDRAFGTTDAGFLQKNSTWVVNTMTGDATLDHSGVLTIGSAKISYAKIQNVAASRLLGNPTGSPAAPSEISLGATLAFSGTALQTAAFTGDATASANSYALTLATVNANVGSFGSATQCPSVTLDGKGRATAASQTACTPALANITGFGTGVAAALAVNVGTAGAPVLLNGAGGSPSSLGTLPAHTLGGTVSGGGNQINNVIIGTTNPLASFFTTLTAGVNGGTGGSLTLNGATSGSAIIQVNAAAGATTFQLPVGNGTSGFVLSTNGAGVTSWISASGTGTVTSVTCNGGLTGGTFTTIGTCAVDIATATNFRAGTANKILDAAGVFTTETTTTFGATTTFDLSTFINTAVTLTGNITTMTVSNPKAGQCGMITFIQDGTGSRTTVWSSTFKFAGGTTPTLTTGAGGVDTLFYCCRSTSVCQAALNKAFSLWDRPNLKKAA